MKKMTGLLLTLVLIFSLTACGKNETTDNGANQPTQENGTQGSTENEAGSGETQYGVNITMEDLKNALVEALGENYWPNMEIPADMLASMYGITEDMYEEYYGEMPMISANVDTVLIVKAKADKVEAVEEAMNAYRETLVNDTLQYPMNLGKIQASRIETFGQYVCFVQLGADTMEASESGDEAVIEKCQQDNELALEIIENTLVRYQ